MSKMTTVEFHDDTLFAVEQADSDSVFVAVKPIADRLGLDWRAQRQRIQRTPVLAKGGCMMHLPSPGGAQETLCLRLDLVNGWLFGIDVDRVSDEARPRVLAYQEECFAVLFRHFYGRKGETVTVAPPEPAREEPVPVRRSLVTEARQTFGTRAAGSLWLALGLPVVPEMREGRRQSAMDFTYTAIPTQPQPPGSGPA